MRRFSATVMRGKTRRPSGDCASPRRITAWVGRPAMSRPASRMRPARGFGSPQIVISSVDLPAPLAPISVTISPGMTRIDTSESACTGP